MLVKNFRIFFPATAEKNDLDFTKLEKYKTYVKAFESLAKLFCKEISTPFSKIYSLINYLTFENKKNEHEASGQDFFDTSKITYDEKGFELLEAQANLLLQPIFVLSAISQQILSTTRNGEKDFFKVAANEISNLSFSASWALNVLLIVRTTLTAKKSIVKLQETLKKKDITKKELTRQIYDTFLDVASFVMKISEKITPKWCSQPLKTAQSVVNLLKTPAKLKKQKVKEEKALNRFEASIKYQLEQLSCRKLSSKDFLKEFKRLYNQIENSSNCEILLCFKNALQSQSFACIAAPAA